MAISKRSTNAPLIERLWAFGKAELGALAALFIAGLGVSLFLWIADEMQEEGPHGIDERVLMFLRPGGNPHDALGPAWLQRAATELTTLGGTTNLTLIVLIAVAFLLLHKRVASALFVVTAVLGGTGISEVIKALFGRDRPPLMYRAVTSANASFPSGHAMLSTITYLTLGALLAQVMPRRRQKVFVFATAVILALIIGASRVYLGVHWLTDVLAGWSLGAAWAMICWLAAWSIRRFLTQHRTPLSEPPVEEQPS
ncbi:MAG: phosphatase PAP2 family protein [Parcubacteria group bacterium]